MAVRGSQWRPSRFVASIPPFIPLPSVCSRLCPPLSLPLCFLPFICLDSLLHCMSSHLNYCRHCRIATKPTDLTGKVNHLLKMKNSAGESRVIFSFHLFIQRVFLLFLSCCLSVLLYLRSSSTIAFPVFVCFFISFIYLYICVIHLQPFLRIVHSSSIL